MEFTELFMYVCSKLFLYLLIQKSKLIAPSLLQDLIFNVFLSKKRMVSLIRFYEGAEIYIFLLLHALPHQKSELRHIW